MQLLCLQRYLCRLFYDKKIFDHTWRFQGWVSELKQKRHFDVLHWELGMIPSLIVISKYKNVTWSPWCLTLGSRSFRYISQIDLLNSPPSFIVQRLAMKRFVEWRYLPIILLEEFSDGRYSSSQGYKENIFLKWCWVNSHLSFSLLHFPH